MAAELADLLSFLSLESRLDVKCTALEYVLGLTGSQEGKEWIIDNKGVVEKLFELLKDSNDIISKDAHLAIVNLSAGHNVTDSLKDHIPQLLCYLQDPKWKHADKLCTVLSNFSRTGKGADYLFKILLKSGAGKQPDSRQTLYQLVDIFDQWKSYNKHANFNYLASVFLNLSQAQEARQLFLDKSKCILPKLLPYTDFAESHIRRGGIAGLVRNLCFEVGKCLVYNVGYNFIFVTDHHKWLLSEEVDLLPSILLPLAGPEQFKEDEIEKLPVDLQYLPDDKIREPDPDIRKMLLEALLKVKGILCVHVCCA